MIVLEVDDVPPSLNAFGSGNRWKFISEKKKWQQALASQITDAEMGPAESVVVEGEITFPDRRKRDQGNYRFMLEKALGDALTALGILEDDDWDRYSFGNLAAKHAKGVKRTRLILFPGLASA